MLHVPDDEGGKRFAKQERNRRGFSADEAGVVSKDGPMATDKVKGMFQLKDIDLRLRSVHLILKRIEDADGISDANVERAFSSGDVEIKQAGEGDWTIPLWIPRLVDKDYCPLRLVATSWSRGAIAYG